MWFEQKALSISQIQYSAFIFSNYSSFQVASPALAADIQIDFSLYNSSFCLVFTIVHRDHCCDFLLMHKMEESVSENAPLIPVILLKDTQVGVKASGKMTESHTLLSGNASLLVAQFSEMTPKTHVLSPFRKDRHELYYTSKLKQ